MNDPLIRQGLARENLVHVSEATKIAPHVLEKYVSGADNLAVHEIDTLKGYFRGEYWMCGTDSQWKRHVRHLKARKRSRYQAR